MAKKKDKKAESDKTYNTYQVFSSMLQLSRPENRNQRHFWLMGYNDEGLMLCLYLIGVGDYNIRDYSISDILAIAIRAEATKIVIAHSRPEGTSLEPTEEDIDGHFQCTEC